MKIATRFLLTLAGVLVLAGAVLMFIGLSGSHWKLSGLSTVKFETNTYTIHDTFKDISIASDTEDIRIVPSEDGKCSVVFVEPENVQHTAEVKNGTLEIRKQDKRGWKDHMGFAVGDETITVYLPEAAYGALEIREDTGDIDLAPFTFGSIDIEANTGDVACLASASGKLRIATDSGDISIRDVSAGELDLKVSTGKVDVFSVDCSGNLTLKVSTGKASLTGVICRNFVSDGDTGSLKMENVIASGSFDIERTTGDVTFERCDAAELDIETDTGDVKGTLLSDKVFLVKTDTGRVDVPDTVSGGACRVETDTGDVLLKVE